MRRTAHTRYPAHPSKRHALRKTRRLKVRRSVNDYPVFLIILFVTIFSISFLAISFLTVGNYTSQETTSAVRILDKNTVALPKIPQEEELKVNSKKQSKETTEYVKRRICEVFTGKYCREALIIALHESGYNIRARSSAGAIGVMQIHCKSHMKKVNYDCNKLYDLDTNLQIAYQIFQSQGYSWNAWDTKGFILKGQ